MKHEPSGTLDNIFTYTAWYCIADMRYLHLRYIETPTVLEAKKMLRTRCPGHVVPYWIMLPLKDRYRIGFSITCLRKIAEDRKKYSHEQKFRDFTMGNSGASSVVLWFHIRRVPFRMSFIFAWSWEGWWTSHIDRQVTCVGSVKSDVDHGEDLNTIEYFSNLRYLSDRKYRRTRVHVPWIRSSNRSVRRLLTPAFMVWDLVHVVR